MTTLMIENEKVHGDKMDRDLEIVMKHMRQSARSMSSKGESELIEAFKNLSRRLKKLEYMAM